MRVLVLGASGGIGRQVVAQGVRRGLGITAAVRSPAAFAAPPDAQGVRVVRVDVHDGPSVRAAVPGHDAVVLALGSRTPRRPDPVASEGARHVLAAARGAGVRRLVAVSSVGLGEAGAYGPLLRLVVIDGLFRRLAPHQYADVTAMERLVQDSEVDWTIVRPATLTNGPLTGRAVASPDARRGVRLLVSRADVAAFLLDEVVEGTWSRTAVQLGRGPRLLL